MGTQREGASYEPPHIEAVCAAVLRAASQGVDLQSAGSVIVSLTEGDVALARAALSTCARRSLHQSDGWFQAARLIEQALATDAFTSFD